MPYCNDDYVATYDRQKCILKTLVPNCEVVDNGGVDCHTCKKGTGSDQFAIVKKDVSGTVKWACEKMSFPRCTSILNKRADKQNEDEKQECSTCAAGYFVKDLSSE